MNWNSGNLRWIKHIFKWYTNADIHSNYIANKSIRGEQMEYFDVVEGVIALKGKREWTAILWADSVAT